ncbi:MAG: DinB family protein [Leptospiraceae bacterium]|nr:DinB family protein [Leptospiraceae bacterium]
MYILPEVVEVKTIQEMQKQILDIHNSLAEFYSQTPDELFQVQPIPEGWTIKKNIQHTISVNGMAHFILSLWKPIYKLFGTPKNPQPQLHQILVSNRTNINDYGYYPKEMKNYGKKKQILIKKLVSSCEKLANSLNFMTEKELEDLASPFYGMNLKNFIYFILKHNIHHANVVRIRLE